MSSPRKESMSKKKGGSVLNQFAPASEGGGSIPLTNPINSNLHSDLISITAAGHGAITKFTIHYVDFMM